MLRSVTDILVGGREGVAQRQRYVTNQNSRQVIIYDFKAFILDHLQFLYMSLGTLIHVGQAYNEVIAL